MYQAMNAWQGMDRYLKEVLELVHLKYVMKDSVCLYDAI